MGLIDALICRLNSMKSSSCNFNRTETRAGGVGVRKNCCVSESPFLVETYSVEVKHLGGFWKFCFWVGRSCLASFFPRGKVFTEFAFGCDDKDGVLQKVLPV